MKKSHLWALALSAAALSTGVAAQDRMTRAQCQDGARALAELVGLDGEDIRQAAPSIQLSSEGWCQIRKGYLHVPDMNADMIEWRMEEPQRLIRDGIPPLALDVRVTGLEPDAMQNSAPTARPPLTLTASLRQMPDAGQLVLEYLVLENGAGDEMRVSGVLERVFLSSPSMMQVSMGSATFRAGLVSLTLEGTHENPFGFGIEATLIGKPDAQRRAAFQALSRLPAGVMDDASRAELTAFAGDLPRPRGTVELVVQSERGLGIMQVGVAAVTALNVEDVLDILFDGLSIDADWTPADAQAD